METAFGLILGVAIGITLCCLCRSGKVAGLEAELQKAKKECENCDYYRRMLAAEGQLQEIKEDRLRLYRSNVALRRDNKNLYRQIWRSA